MKNYLSPLATLLLLVTVCASHGGTLSYFPIAPPQSDANSGISKANQYTTAIDGGNAKEPGRLINGIKLSSLVGAGSSATADNCTVNALSGVLANAGMSPEGVQADGTVRDVMSDVVINNGATDNSQQEIVLDPESLEAGVTYDLRVYIGKSGDRDRVVNLEFVGDGQAAAETGFFNEDDARTGQGRFQDPNQVYYINYRFTWDGESTPGITITQKSGQSPFVLYALTNQPVAARQAAAPPAQEGGGIQMGQVSAETEESDQVGVTSDTFYADESLNKNGRWIGIKKYGRCWQPSDRPANWRPYTRGNFRHNDEGGWTWVSDASEEDWGWATYHYGRWARVEGVGCGWAWVPGTVWSGAWVSWRNGQTPDCTCVGWAPLPPETRCEVNVGVSRWVDRTADIGPDHYTFVNVRDFGSDNYERCGCVLERKRYVNIIEHTVNITNISYTRGRRINVYNGGPDLNWCNTEIRRQGGREIVGIRVNLFADRSFGGNRWEGNTLNLHSPRIVATKSSKFLPKITINIPNSKIDRGWKHDITARQAKELRLKIADQTKGLTPETTKATLPTDVAARQKQFGQDPEDLKQLERLQKQNIIQPEKDQAGGGLKTGNDLTPEQQALIANDPLNLKGKGEPTGLPGEFGAAGPAGPAAAVPGFDSEKSESAMGEAWKTHVAKNGYAMPTDPALVNAIKYEAAANKTTPEKIVAAYQENANKKTIATDPLGINKGKQGTATGGTTDAKTITGQLEETKTGQLNKETLAAPTGSKVTETNSIAKKPEGANLTNAERDKENARAYGEGTTNAGDKNKPPTGLKIDGAGQGNAGNAANVDWKAQVKGDGKDALPTNPAVLNALNADAARQGVPPETLFNQYKTQVTANEAQSKANKFPNNLQLKGLKEAADADAAKAASDFNNAAEKSKVNAGAGKTLAPGEGKKDANGLIDIAPKEARMAGAPPPTKGSKLQPLTTEELPKEATEGTKSVRGKGKLGKPGDRIGARTSTENVAGGESSMRKTGRPGQRIDRNKALTNTGAEGETKPPIVKVIRAGADAEGAAGPTGPTGTTKSRGKLTNKGAAMKSKSGEPSADGPPINKVVRQQTVEGETTGLPAPVETKGAVKGRKKSKGVGGRQTDTTARLDGENNMTETTQRSGKRTKVKSDAGAAQTETAQANGKRKPKTRIGTAVSTDGQGNATETGAAGRGGKRNKQQGAQVQGQGQTQTQDQQGPKKGKHKKGAVPPEEPPAPAP